MNEEYDFSKEADEVAELVEKEGGIYLEDIGDRLVEVHIADSVFSLATINELVRAAKRNH